MTNQIRVFFVIFGSWLTPSWPHTHPTSWTLKFSFQTGSWGMNTKPKPDIIIFDELSYYSWFYFTFFLLHYIENWRILNFQNGQKPPRLSIQTHILQEFWCRPYFEIPSTCLEINIFVFCFVMVNPTVVIMQIWIFYVSKIVKFMILTFYSYL